jgi:adenylate cyclase
MTDDVITLLSSDPNFSVAARNSAFSYKGEFRDVRAVAQELGVRYVVEGGARGVGERIRVSVQLIDAESGSHLWAERFDRPIAEIFDVQDEVIDGIVVALGGELYRAEAMRAHRRSSDSLDAWGLVARATTDLGKLGTSGFEEIDRLTNRAITLDPEFALAYAVRANALGMGTALGAGSDFAETVAAAEQAMTLGPDDPLVLAYSANALVWSGQPERALPIAERSYELAPHIATTYGVLGFAHLVLGHPDQAIANIERALEMSPRDISRGRWYSTMAGAYINKQQWSDAVSAATKATERMPDFGSAWMQLSVAQRMLGQIDSSVESARTATERAPRFSGGWSSLANALSITGHGQAAVDAARVASSLPSLLGPVDHWLALANCLALVGEHEEALEAWERAQSVSVERLSIDQIEATRPAQPVAGLKTLRID